MSISSQTLGDAPRVCSGKDRPVRILAISFFIISLSLNVQAQSTQQQQDAIQGNSRALALWNQGNLEEAEPILRRALSLAERGFGPKHPNTGKISKNLGSLLYQQEKYQEAILVCEQTLIIAESNRDYATYAGSCETLGLAYLQSKQYAKAAEAFAKGLPYQKQYASVQQDAETRVNLGRALLASGEPAKAIPYLRTGFAVIEHEPTSIKYGQTAIASFDLAVALGETNQYSEAEVWFEKTLKIREQVWGKDSFGYNKALHNMGVLKNRMKKSKEAMAYLKPALEFFRKDTESGPDDSETIKAMTSLATCLTDLGELQESESLLTEACRLMSEKNRSDEDEVAYGAALRELAVTQHKANRNSEASDNIALSLKILRKHLPAGHLEIQVSESRQLEISKESAAEPFQSVTPGGPMMVVKDSETVIKAEPNNDAESIQKVAAGTQYWILQTSGSWQRVFLPELQQFGWVEKQALAPVEPPLAERAALTEARQQIISAGRLYYGERDPVAAEKLYRKSLETRRRILGDNHPDTALSLNGLGTCAYAVADYPTAIEYFQKSWEIRRLALGPDHPDTGVSANNLAGVYMATGDYLKAEPLFLTTLKILRETKGEQHLQTAAANNNLGLLYYQLREYAKAEPLLLACLAIQEATLGNHEETTTTTINNLGLLYSATGEFKKAEVYLRRSVKAYSEQFGEQDHRTAMAMGNLGDFYRRNTDEHQKAEDLLQKSFENRRQVLGARHPLTATSQANLGLFYKTRQKYDQALPLLTESLQIRREAASGLSHEPALMQLNVAALRDAMGENGTALEMCRESVDALQTAVGKKHPDTARALNQFASSLLRGGGENESLNARHEARQAIRDHLVRVLPGMPRSSQQSYVTEFAYPDLEEALSHGLHFRANPQAVEMSAEWLLNSKASVEEALADADLLNQDEALPLTRELRVVQGQIAKIELAAPDSAARQSQRLEELKDRQDELLRELNRFRVAPATQESWVSIKAVQGKLPAGAALINIAKFRVRDFLVHDGDSRWQASRYVAWVIPAGETNGVKLVDLGDAAIIDRRVSALRSAIHAAPAELSQTDESIALEKFNQLADDLSQRILDPLLPLIEDLRELCISPDDQLWTVPWAALPLSDQFLLEKFQIRFLVSGRELIQEPPSAIAPGSAVVIADPDFDLQEHAEDSSRSQTRTGSRLSDSVHFLRLPGTAAEAAFIVPYIESLTGSQPTVLLQQAALESTFKALKQPRILVMSTHGYFEKRADIADQIQSDFDNPLLRCGLALAGCNYRSQAGAVETAEDGIVTGLEIVGLDLRGTELVVLSACETGLGDLGSGHSVAGLRQAFHLAGAQTVVSSLWQVDDSETSKLMGDFFEALSTGKSHGDALRSAQLDRIQKRRMRFGAAHPFYWSAFTLTGI